MSEFRPSIWAKQVKSRPDYEDGDLLWLLAHWYWPFTESDLARWYFKVCEESK